jgi:hypothetical protein
MKASGRSAVVRLQPLLIAVGLGLMILLLVRQWDSLVAYEWRIDIVWLAASGLLVLGGWSIEIRLWQRLLALLGGRLDFLAAIRIWFASSIVRYIPGNVWQPLNMTVLCAQRNIQPEVTLASTLLFHAVHMLAVAIVTAGYVGIRGLLGMPAMVLGSLSGWGAACLASPVILFVIWPRPLLALGNGVLVRWGRRPLPSDVSSTELARLLGVCLASWGFVCAGFAALIRALGLGLEDSFAGTFVHLGAAYPVAYALGFLSFLTPGGLAVREGVLILLLEPILGGGRGLVVALAMRLWEVSLEIVVGGSIVGFGQLLRPTRPH